MIFRHLTAITRTSVSTPVRRLWDRVRIGNNILDYGCGKGTDVIELKKKFPSCLVNGYDPYFFPDEKVLKIKYDIIFCSFVLNVIEDPQERIDLVIKLEGMLKPNGRILFTIRSKVDVERHAIKGKWKKYNDGYITSKNTFQKGFTKDEFGAVVMVKLPPPHGATPEFIAVWGYAWHTNTCVEAIYLWDTTPDKIKMIKDKMERARANPGKWTR